MMRVVVHKVRHDIGTVGLRTGAILKAARSEWRFRVTWPTAGKRGASASSHFGFGRATIGALEVAETPSKAWRVSEARTLPVGATFRTVFFGQGRASSPLNSPP